ncbi:C-GCAxxG-C-C family protein [Chloroflexota bacterium]
MARLITPEEVDDAIQKMRFPKPKISSDEAAKMALDLFQEHPEPNHCAPTTIKTLQAAYDLPGGDLPFWISTGFRGGVCLGEVCGAISGAVIAMGLIAYRVLEPGSDYQEKIACQAIASYIRDLAYAFNYKFGSIHCSVLTRASERTPVEAEIHRRTLFGKYHVCGPLVEFVVRTMVHWGETSVEPPKRVPMGTPPLKLG